MTSKLKCPFCGQELRFAATDVVWYCRKHGFLSGNEKLWQALIQSQRDLQIAISALQYLGYEFPPAYPEKNVIAEMRQKARNAVAQITHDNNEAVIK